MVEKKVVRYILGTECTLLIIGDHAKKHLQVAYDVAVLFASRCWQDYTCWRAITRTTEDKAAWWCSPEAGSGSLHPGDCLNNTSLNILSQKYII
jgi:hypothetical protein